MFFGIRDGKKSGSGINIQDPQHWHIYNWYHSNVTDIHYVHEYRLHEFRLIPLLLAFLHSLLLPICTLFTYLEPSLL
jgi:hypothetical protein